MGGFFEVRTRTYMRSGRSAPRSRFSQTGCSRMFSAAQQEWLRSVCGWAGNACSGRCRKQAVEEPSMMIAAAQRCQVLR